MEIKTPCNLGANLKRLRNERGYTQLYVSKLLGVTEGTVCHYERGVCKPPLDKLIALSELFNTSLDEFIN